MKKFLSVCFIAVSLCCSVFAFDWGGIFNDTTKLSTPDFKSYPLDHSDAVYLWLKAPLNPNLSFSAEVFYKFLFSVSNNKFTPANIIDSDLFKLSGDYAANNGVFSFSLGRFAWADPTAAVFSQVSDGFYLRYSLPVVKVASYIGYTGLLNANSINMIESSSKAKDSDFYTLCRGYIPFAATVEFPVLFSNSSLTLSGNGYIDSEKADQSKFYANLLLSGPIVNSLYYSLSTTFGTQKFETCMNYSVCQLIFFPVRNVMISAGAQYASADNNGFLSAFHAITYTAAYNSVSAPELSGVIIPSLSMTGTFGKLYLNPAVKYVISAENVSNPNLGLEADFNVVYNFFTDLKVGLDISYFADFTGSNQSLASATLNAALSF